MYEMQQRFTMRLQPEENGAIYEFQMRPTTTFDDFWQWLTALPGIPLDEATLHRQEHEHVFKQYHEALLLNTKRTLEADMPEWVRGLEIFEVDVPAPNSLENFRRFTGGLIEDMPPEVFAKMFGKQPRNKRGGKIH